MSEFAESSYEHDIFGICIVMGEYHHDDHDERDSNAYNFV